MKESKCWIDDSTGKIVFEDVDMAIAFNLEKQEEIRDYVENKKKLKETIRKGLVKMIPTPLRVEPDTWDMVSEVANEEKKRIKNV